MIFEERGFQNRRVDSGRHHCRKRKRHGKQREHCCERRFLGGEHNCFCLPNQVCLTHPDPKPKQAQEHHSKKSQTSERYEFPSATSYKSNPALNNVTLAHALWASALRPNCDVAIDAPCGNGNDSIVLAEILFTNDSEGGELLCVDVQSLACERTTMALKEVLPQSVTAFVPKDDDANTDNSKPMVRVLNESHEQLPRPSNPEAQAGLIVYNLGWLPGGETAKWQGLCHNHGQHHGLAGGCDLPFARRRYAQCGDVSPDGTRGRSGRQTLCHVTSPFVESAADPTGGSRSLWGL